MKCSAISRHVIMMLFSIFLLTICFGCAKDQKNTKKDPSFEKWSTLAETSKGHSPAMEPKKINIQALTAKQTMPALAAGSVAKQLPSKLINLTMRQAELKAVLRALARSVDLNILVKNDLKGEINVDFKNIPWNQAFTGLLRTYGLSYIWEGNIIRVMTSEDLEIDLKQKISARDIQWVEPLLQPILINIDYADAKKLSETMQDFLTKDKDGKPRGSVKVDEHSNSLVISAMRDDLEKILQIISKIDKPTPQILIKANIVETSKNVARDLGIKWGGYNASSVGGGQNLYVTGGKGVPTGGIGDRGFGANFPAGSAGAAVLDATTGPLGTLGLMFGKIGGNLLEVELQALQKDSKLNIISSPSITTLDNQLAFTENGQRVPFVTITPGIGGAAPTQTVTFENAVMRLEITPHVIDGKNMKMKIKVVKDELDFTHAATMLGNPIIIKKLTETSLIVKDGETIVISGLTKETRGDGDAGVPWLKDVPVLGWVFKADNKNEAMEEILIFITPYILQVSSNSQSNAEQIVEGTSPKKDAEINQKEPEKKVN